MRAAHAVPGFGLVWWDDRDRHRGLTRLAAAGLVLGGTLAVIGLPPLPLHLPTHYLGIMGPLCGMTRATVAVLRADVALGWRYNPGSLVLVAGALAVLVRALAGYVSGRWLTAHLRVSRGGWCVIVGALAALTVNQQVHAALLAS